MCCWERMLRRKSIVDIDDNEAKFPAQQATEQGLALQISNTPTTAVVHDVQWSTDFVGCVCSHLDFLAIAYHDVLVLLFFHSSYWRPARSRFRLCSSEEFTETLDIREITDVECFTSRGLEDLDRTSMGLSNGVVLGDVLPLPILG